MRTSALDALRLSAAALCCATVMLLPARAQTQPQTQATAARTEDVERGRALLRGGDAKGAARVFRAAVKARAGDAEAWHDLGVALAHGDDQKGARKAFEQAVRLRPDFAAAHSALAYTLLASNKLREALRRAERALELDADAPHARYVVGALRLRDGDAAGAQSEAEAAINSAPDFAPAYLLKSQALLAQSAGPIVRPPQGGASAAAPPELSAEERKRLRIAAARRYKDAADSMEKFLALAPASRARWGEQLESLRVHGKYAEEPDGARTVYSSGDDSTQRAVIIRKPEPGYTEQARKNDVSGVVRLRAVLDADGKVKHILVLRGLPDGLTEKAVSAARRIEFRPALRDGRPVAQYVTLEYNFNVY